jgi:hypothetical protein
MEGTYRRTCVAGDLRDGEVVEDVDPARQLIGSYYPLRSFPARALDALEELLSNER